MKLKHQLTKSYRRIDDACGSVALHLVSGIWGQLSVGFFADPPSGPKGLFLGGGPYQLILQTISSVSLTIFTMIAAFIIFNLVDRIIPMKLSPEEELLGCDITEHDIGTNPSTEIRRHSTKLEKIIEITTPITKRFTGFVVDNSMRRNSDSLFRQKQFYINEGYEKDWPRY